MFVYKICMDCKNISAQHSRKIHIDLAKACLKISVDQQTSEIVAVNTHSGLFLVKHLAFGVPSVPKEFF